MLSYLSPVLGGKGFASRSFRATGKKHKHFYSRFMRRSRIQRTRVVVEGRRNVYRGLQATLPTKPVWCYFGKKKVAAWAANGSSPGTQAAAIALPCLALPRSTQPCGSSARSLLFDDVTLFIAPQSGLETASVCIEKKRRRVSFFSFRCNRDCALLTTSVLESLHLTPRRGNSGFAIITVISLQSRCHVDRRILTGTRLASLSWSKGVGP